MIKGGFIVNILQGEKANKTKQLVVFNLQKQLKKKLFKKNSLKFLSIFWAFCGNQICLFGVTTPMEVKYYLEMEAEHHLSTRKWHEYFFRL